MNFLVLSKVKGVLLNGCESDVGEKTNVICLHVALKVQNKHVCLKKKKNAFA